MDSTEVIATATPDALAGHARKAAGSRPKEGWLREAGVSFEGARTKIVALLPCLLGLLGIAGCTWIFFGLGQNLGSVGFLYLVFVVLTALYGGFWQATLVSVVAAACLDYFFDEPIFSFTVVRVSNWVELGVFEFTAVIISQLSNRAHRRELEAIAERRDTARLYQTARRILLFENPSDLGNRVCSAIRETFELRHVVLFEADSGSVSESGEATGEERQSLVSRCREAYLGDTEFADAGARSHVHPLRFGLRPTGAVALSGQGLTPLIATALASLAANALERARALERQCEAEAGRQAEQLRTAVLDALAHKFKTPLTVIRTASSGLPAVGPLSGPQRELVSLIDQEARMLNDLASRLMGAPSLDVKEFQPQPEPLLLSRLIKEAIQELDHAGDRQRFRVAAATPEPPVFADRQLILTALAQLVDNALKYSRPGSLIDAGIEAGSAEVVLKLRSEGLVVSDVDSERIFNRFYRAPGAERFSAGTGLGLSIVKTIAEDHAGKVWAVGEPDYGSVFAFALPLMQGVACEQ